MYSILVTAAIFIAMVFNDIIQHGSKHASLHAFLGALATGLVTILWYLNFEIVSWGLIIIPIVAIIISYIVISTKKGTGSTGEATTGPVLPSSPPPACAPSNLAGPYTTVAAPPPSTVSLPAVPPAPTTSAMSTSIPTPTSTITPITAC